MELVLWTRATRVVCGDSMVLDLWLQFGFQSAINSLDPESRPRELFRC